MNTTNTSNADFINQVRSDRAAWESLIASIPDERKSAPGAVGDWSVKDTIAHITVYERWTIEWLEPALSGDPPTWDYPDDYVQALQRGDETLLTLDGRNAHFFEQNRDRNLEDIQTEAADIYARLLPLLERIPADAFGNDIQAFASEVGVYYEAGTSVTEAINANTAEHYRGHTADVRGWLAK